MSVQVIPRVLNTIFLRKNNNPQSMFKSLLEVSNVDMFCELLIFLTDEV